MSEMKCKRCGTDESRIDGFGRQVEPDWQTRIEKAQRELREYIAELEAENKKVFDYVRKLRMYCIYAEWGNPDTEDEFNEFDKEICKYLSEYLEVQE